MLKQLRIRIHEHAPGGVRDTLDLIPKPVVGRAVTASVDLREITSAYKINFLVSVLTRRLQFGEVFGFKLHFCAFCSNTRPSRPW